MKCPLCDERTFSEWGKINAFTIMRCVKCGVGITSPFPTAETLAASNTSIYTVDQRVMAYLSRRKYFEKRYAGYVKQIKAFKASGRLLDIGCNIGLFLHVAQQQGFDVEGVELNKACAEYGNSNLNIAIHTDYLGSIGFQDESFDVVTMFDVLEHIPDLHGVMKEVQRILKKDGLLVVQSPNIDSLMSRLTKAKWNWLTPPDHVYHFTPATLSSCIERHGFEIRMLKTWEPFEDFLSNIVTAGIGTGIIGRGLAKLITMFWFIFVPFRFIQRRWWNKQQGGLIEIYASKDARTESSGG